MPKSHHEHLIVLGPGDSHTIKIQREDPEPCPRPRNYYVYYINDSCYKTRKAELTATTFDHAVELAQIGVSGNERLVCVNEHEH